MNSPRSVTASDPPSRFRDVLVGLLALLALNALGCGTRPYTPGALAATAPVPEGAARTRGCLDLGATVARREGDLLVVFVFGNRCAQPVPLDLSRARVVAMAGEPPVSSTPLRPLDPRREIGPRHVDAEEWGSEMIGYELPPSAFERVCITFETEGVEPICVSADEHITDVREWGWLDARFRGPQSFRSRACNRGRYATDSHVVGEATCTRFGDLWSYEGRPPVAVGVGARFAVLPTFSSITSRDAHANGDRVHTFELAAGVRGFLRPWFYVGGGMSMGGSPAPARTLVVPNDANGSTVGVLAFGSELTTGARVALGRRVRVEGEAAFGARLVSLLGPTDFADVRQRRFDVDYAVLSVAPRLALELFVSHDIALRAFGGADVVHGFAPQFGVEVAQHRRSYGGPPLP